MYLEAPVISVHLMLGFTLLLRMAPSLGEVKVGAPQVVKCLITDQSEVSVLFVFVAQTLQ